MCVYHWYVCWREFRVAFARSCVANMRVCIRLGLCSCGWLCVCVSLCLCVRLGMRVCAHACVRECLRQRACVACARVCMLVCLRGLCFLSFVCPCLFVVVVVDAVAVVVVL